MVCNMKTRKINLLRRDQSLIYSRFYSSLPYIFQVNCLFLDGVKWSKDGMKVGSIDGKNVECLTDHLSTFTMVVLPDHAKVNLDD